MLKFERRRGARLVRLRMFCKWTLCPALSCHHVHTRSQQGRAHRPRRCFATTLPPFPDAISSGPNLSRRYCLCARSRGWLLSPDQSTGSDCQRNSLRSTGAGRDRREGRSPALSCSHTLHRGKAGSSRTGRIVHSVSAIPSKRSQSDRHRRFPCRLGRL